MLQCDSVVASQPLPTDGGMAEDHGAPESGQLPMAMMKDHRETNKFIAGQCRMRREVSWDECPLALH